MLSPVKKLAMPPFKNSPGTDLSADHWFSLHNHLHQSVFGHFAVLVRYNFSFLIDNADIHSFGMQIDATQ